MGNIELRNLQTCDTCRELNIECEGSAIRWSSPCSTCIANKVQCEGTLARFNQDMSRFISGGSALQGYQMQLMLLEQQNKRRLLQARAEQANASSSAPQPTQGSAGSSHPDVLPDRIFCSTVEGASHGAGQHQPGNAGVPATIPYQNTARQDYEMQLMLLEQQNKRRLLQARAEQANASSSAVQLTQQFAGSRQPHFSRDHSSTCAAQYTTNWTGHRYPIDASAPAIASNQNPAKQTLYNDQLMLLEQQNKARLLEARARQHVTFAPVVQHTQGFSETSQSPVTLGPPVALEDPARNLQS